MSDPRLTPDPARVHTHDAAQIGLAVVDLCRRPGRPRDRQLLFGDHVVDFGAAEGWHYLQSDKDGYCGFVREGAIAPAETPTHRVCAPATHAYAEADFKSPDRISLSFGSRVTVTGQNERFSQTALGHIPLVHLEPVDERSSDPAQIAAMFLGTPYLWGGNSRWGLDCSGLVQAAMLACGVPCPGDSDQQMALGEAATGGYQRNDLLFWKGHVALVVDAQTLIHANAASMSTRFEGIADTIQRISDQGDGDVTAHRRVQIG